jgi:hypothetical protein
MSGTKGSIGYLNDDAAEFQPVRTTSMNPNLSAPVVPVDALASTEPTESDMPSLITLDEALAPDGAPITSLLLRDQSPGLFLATSVTHDDGIGFFCVCTACTGGDQKLAPAPVITPALGDDIPDDISSTVTLAIGSTLSSSIQSSGDRDYIKVSLVAGQTYTFALETTGLVDPYLELRSAANVLLKENDDGGILYDSFLTYTPTVTGDYFIVARDYSSDVGSYDLTAAAIQTGNSSPTTFISNGKTPFSWDEAAIQISRTGASWANDFQTSAVVTYAYRSTAPSTMPSDTAGFTRFSAAQIAANEAALASWADVANITFVRQGSGTSGDAAYSNSATMLFANYSSGASGAAAFAYLPSTANTSFSSAQGDVWINASIGYNANPIIGDYGPHVLLHEIGHAIGLSHPGDYNAAPGVSITYSANALLHELFWLIQHWRQCAGLRVDAKPARYCCNSAPLRREHDDTNRGHGIRVQLEHDRCKLHPDLRQPGRSLRHLGRRRQRHPRSLRLFAERHDRPA